MASGNRQPGNNVVDLAGYLVISYGLSMTNNHSVTRGNRGLRWKMNFSYWLSQFDDERPDKSIRCPSQANKGVVNTTVWVRPYMLLCFLSSIQRTIASL